MISREMQRLIRLHASSKVSERYDRFCAHLRKSQQRKRAEDAVRRMVAKNYGREVTP